MNGYATVLFALIISIASVSAGQEVPDRWQLVQAGTLLAVPGRPAVELLAEVIPEFFGAIHWYKTMRWASESTPFVRPVHWLAAVLGDAVIPTEFAGVRSGNQSQGHRFLAPQPITVTAEREAYLQTLREAYVYVDQDERKQLIRDKITASATGAGLIWREDDGLLEQVTNLVEYPVPVLCSFAER